MTALKAATDNPEGTFMSATTEAGPAGLEAEEVDCCGQGGGLDIVSATTLLTPDIYQISEVYSAM
jgi:hypothetical protein